MADVFGATREVGSDVLIGDGIAFSIDGSLSLVQSGRLTYQQEVKPVYEVGTSDIYVIAGQTSGTLDISKGVHGTGGSLDSTGKCADLTTIQIAAGKGCVNFGGTITAAGAILQRVGLQVQAGATIVTSDSSYALFNVEAGQKS
jgi:hypothetical protein